MNEFIEKNKGLLKFYCIAARIIGWGILILAGTGVIIQILAGDILYGKYAANYRPLFVKSVLFDGVLPGILILGISQFIRYLFESEYKPSFLLRQGDKILYLYAFLLMAGVVWHYLILSMMEMGINFTRMLPAVLASLVLIIPKILILIGLAQVVKRILPVIEESKTLV